MKKSVLAVLSAITVFAIGSISVFAASPTVRTTEAPAQGQKAATSVSETASPADYASATKASEGYKVEEVSQATVDSAAVAVQNELLNKLSAVGNALNNTALAAAAADPSKKVTASIMSVVEVNPTTAAKDADGNYVVTLNINGILSGDTIAVLHYTGTEWEVIAPTKTAAGEVTFSTKSLSPISVVKLDVTDVTASPQTGETIPAAVWIACIGLIGAAFCGKKYFA